MCHNVLSPATIIMTIGDRNSADVCTKRHDPVQGDNSEIESRFPHLYPEHLEIRMER